MTAHAFPADPTLEALRVQRDAYAASGGEAAVITTSCATSSSSPSNAFPLWRSHRRAAARPGLSLSSRQGSTTKNSTRRTSKARSRRLRCQPSLKEADRNRLEAKLRSYSTVSETTPPSASSISPVRGLRRRGLDLTACHSGMHPPIMGIRSPVLPRNRVPWFPGGSP